MSYRQDFFTGLQQALTLIFSGDQVVIDTTLRTLRLGVESTAIAALIGVPSGALIGLGRSRAARALLGLANSLTRAPPVVVGVVVVLLDTSAPSPDGGGPLAALHLDYGYLTSAYLAQTLLVLPIVVALTASAVQRVPGVLLDQARAFGAPGWRRGGLAVREARRGVLAAIIVALGVTITSIGAIAVASNYHATLSTGGGNVSEPTTLALGAFQAFTEAAGGKAGPGVSLVQFPTQALGVAYATVLLGLFVLLAAALTWLQQERTWIPGHPS